MHSARRWTVAVLLLFASPLISQNTKAADSHLVVVRAAKMLDVKAEKLLRIPWSLLRESALRRPARALPFLRARKSSI